jgi:plastocyanin
MTSRIRIALLTMVRDFRIAVAFAIVSGLATGAAVAQQAAAVQPATITIDNFTLSPADVTVPMGTVVTWRDHDDIPHSVVGPNGAFRSTALDTDESYSFAFKTAGTFIYFCGLHPHMTGRVIVKP